MPGLSPISSSASLDLLHTQNVQQNDTDITQSTESGSASDLPRPTSRPNSAIMQGLDTWRHDQKAKPLVQAILDGESVNFEGVDFNIRKSCAAQLVERDPVAFVSNVYDLNIEDTNEETKTEWLDKAAGHDEALRMLANEVDAFDIQNEKTLKRIGQRIAEKFPEEIANYIHNAAKGWNRDDQILWKPLDDKTPPHQVEWSLVALAHRARLKPVVVDAARIEKHLVASLSNLFKVAGAVMSPQTHAPVHSWFRDKAATLHPEDVNGKWWVESAAVAFIGLAFDEAAWKEIEMHLHAAFKVHAPLLRYAVTRQLVGCVSDPAMAASFIDVSKKFKSHTKILLPALFRLSEQKNASDSFWKTIIDLTDSIANRDVFKSSKNQLRLLDSLSCMEHYDDQDFPISAQEKLRLLKLCIPAQNSPETAREFIVSLQALSAMLRLCGSHSKEAASTYARILNCQTMSDIHQALNATTLDVFPNRSGLTNTAYLKRLKKFEENIGHSNILIRYRSRLVCIKEMPGEENWTERLQQVLIQFNEFVHILMSNGEASWEQMLQEPEMSLHAAALREINKKAVEQWHQPTSTPLFDDNVPPLSNRECGKILLQLLEKHQEEHPDIYQALTHAGEDATLLSSMLQKLTIKDKQEATESKETAGVVHFLHFWRLLHDRRDHALNEKISRLNQCIQMLPEGGLRNALWKLMDRLEEDDLRIRYKGFTIEDTGSIKDRMRANNDVHNCLSADSLRNEIGAFLHEQLNVFVRFVAIKNPEGEIRAQSALHALIGHEQVGEAEVKREMVHVLEYPYNNSLPKKLERRMIDFAKSKAHRDGCKLLTADDRMVNNPEENHYKGFAVSVGSPAPWAYIEREGLIKDGIYQLTSLYVI